MHQTHVKTEVYAVKTRIWDYIGALVKIVERIVVERIANHAQVIEKKNF